MVNFKLVKEIEKDVLHLVTSVGTKRVSFFGTVVEHRNAEFEGLRHLFLIYHLFALQVALPDGLLCSNN